MPKNNLRTIILIPALLLTSLAIAQNKYTVEGEIVNAKNQPISAATVTLQNTSDSAVVILSLTNKEGKYKIVASSVNNTQLKAEAPGYIAETKIVRVNQSLVNFSLRADNKLSEVIVASSKPIVEQKADRSIFNIENSVAADAGDAYMALKKTPGVQVMQSQIMIGGKGGVSVMLNGRLQQLSGDDLIQFLHSIPSSTLSKIEVITAPGVKYDAEGNNGIINLVTKKNLNIGLRGSASAACTKNKYYSPSGSISLQYRTGKLNLFSNNSINQWNWLYTGITSVFFGDQRTYQVNNTAYSTTNGRIHLGGDYTLTEQTTLGFSYAQGFGGSENNEDVLAKTYSHNNEIADSSIHTTGNTHDVYKDRHTANLNYEWRMDSSGRKLNVDADYFAQSTERERDFRVQDYLGSESLLQGFIDNRIYSASSVSIRSIKADVELPYTFARLSLGAKASFVYNEGSLQYLTKAAGDYLTDSSKCNRFLFDEQIQAAYINGKKKIGRFDIQAGVRIERIWNKGYTPATNRIFTRDYIKAFPSLSLQYKMNDQQSLAFNYIRRINRPGYNLLNPFRFYLNPNSFVEGNADLEPSFNDALDLTWFITPQYFVRFRTNQIHNYWDRLYFTDSTAGTTSLTRANVGNAAYYALNFNFSKTVAKWWDVQGFVGAEYSWFRLHAYGVDRFYNGVNGWVEITNTFYLNKNKTLIAELHAYYYSARQKDYKRWGEMSLLDGGIKAMLLNKKLVLGLSFEDPFQKAYWDQKNEVNGTEEFSYDNARLATFSVTYKFGNNNLKSKRERSDSVEEIQRAR